MFSGVQCPVVRRGKEERRRAPGGRENSRKVVLGAVIAIQCPCFLPVTICWDEAVIFLGSVFALNFGGRKWALCVLGGRRRKEGDCTIMYCNHPL